MKMFYIFHPVADGDEDGHGYTIVEAETHREAALWIAGSWQLDDIVLGGKPLEIWVMDEDETVKEDDHETKKFKIGIAAYAEEVSDG